MARRGEGGSEELNTGDDKTERRPIISGVGVVKLLGLTVLFASHDERVCI
jgi:hypothetical protein